MSSKKEEGKKKKGPVLMNSTHFLQKGRGERPTNQHQANDTGLKNATREEEKHKGEKGKKRILPLHKF